MMWKRVSRWLWVALLLPGAAAAGPPPAVLEIAYEVQRNGSTIAEITGRLERSGEAYKLTETWQGRGLYSLLGRAKRTSEGSVGAGRVRPREFTDERTGRDTARAAFDWGANLLTSRYKGKTRTEPIPANAQDRLSYVLAMAAAPADSKVFDVHLVDGRGTSHHVYDFGGRERVSTPAGEFDALKVTRGPEDDRTTLWLALELGKLPVRMLVVDKSGNRAEQFATRITRP